MRYGSLILIRFSAISTSESMNASWPFPDSWCYLQTLYAFPNCRFVSVIPQMSLFKWHFNSSLSNCQHLRPFWIAQQPNRLATRQSVSLSIRQMCLALSGDNEFSLSVHFRSALRHRWHSVFGYRNDSNTNWIVSERLALFFLCDWRPMRRLNLWRQYEEQLLLLVNVPVVDFDDCRAVGQWSFVWSHMLKEFRNSNPEEKKNVQIRGKKEKF